MEKIVDLFQDEGFLIAFLIIIAILIVFTIINFILLLRNNRKYIKFMEKIGNGNNLDEMLREYLNDVKDIKKDNS